MKKRVIAFVPLPPPYAGPEIATQALLDALSLPQDCELRVVKANVRTSNDKRGNFDREGILRAGKSLGNLFLTCLRFRPQKVYLLINPSRAGFLRDAAAIFIARLFFCKVVAHYHGSRFHTFYQTVSSFYRWLIRITLAQVDQMMVQAERLKNIFSGLIPPPRMAVLYNGVSDGCLERGAKALALRRKKKGGAVSFLFLNHISFTKGFYELMQACEKLTAEGKDVRLLIAGDFILNSNSQAEFLEGPRRQFYLANALRIHQEILQFVQRPSLPGIRYYGVVAGEEKYRLLEEADVLVLPSYTEGFPNVVLEAMAFGLGLIVTPVGALPEILQELEQTLFARPGDAVSLCEQMDRFTADPALSLRMGKNNAAFAAGRFSMRSTGRRFQELVFG